jgi:hypothetical protein
MEMLGHPQISLTMNTYTHLLPEADREAADAMQWLFETISPGLLPGLLPAAHRGPR